MSTKKRRIRTPNYFTDQNIFPQVPKIFSIISYKAGVFANYKKFNTLSINGEEFSDELILSSKFPRSKYTISTHDSTHYNLFEVTKNSEFGFNICAEDKMLGYLTFGFVNNGICISEIQGMNQYWDVKDIERNKKLINMVKWDKALLSSAITWAFSSGAEFVYIDSPLNNRWLKNTYNALKRKKLIDDDNIDTFLQRSDKEIREIDAKYRNSGNYRKKVENHIQKNKERLIIEIGEIYGFKLKDMSINEREDFIQNMMIILVEKEKFPRGLHLLPETACKRYIDLPLSMGFSVYDDYNLVMVNESLRTNNLENTIIDFIFDEEISLEQTKRVVREYLI